MIRAPKKVNLCGLNFLDLIFNEYEDNIIMNLKNTKMFQKLVEEKGEWAVKEREEFLKNEI